MKFPAKLALIFTLLITMVVADTFPLEFVVPKTWKYDGPAVNAGPNNDWPTQRFVPTDNRNAAALITVMPTGAIPNLKALKAGHEKRVAIQTKGTDRNSPFFEVKVNGGTAIASTHEDPDLIGKPPVREDYKFTTLVEVLYDDGTCALISLFTDEGKGTTLDEAWEIVKKAKVVVSAEARKPKKGNGMDGEVLRLTFPSLDAALEVPYEGFQPYSEVQNKEPTYFAYAKQDGLMLSGWLEPVSKYPGFRSLWDRDKVKIEAGIGMPFQDEAFGSLGGWQYVTYNIRLGANGRQINLRASRTWGHTWADVHLSSTNPEHSLETLKKFLSTLNLTAAKKPTPAGAMPPPASKPIK